MSVECAIKPIVVAAVLLLASAAHAQSNSLLKRRPVRPMAAPVATQAVVAGMTHSVGSAASAQPVAGAQPANMPAFVQSSPQMPAAMPTHAAPRGFGTARAPFRDSPPPMPVLGAAPPFVRQSPTAAATEDVANPVLQALSPIAVTLPPPQKIGVNDLVTIIIREDKQATVDAKMKSDRDWKANAALAKWLRLDPQDRLIPQTFPKGIPEVEFEMDSQYGGEGKTNRKETLVTRITARVLDVKPNGNLVLEARKEVNGTGDERQIMTLTGECRSRDVTNQNTVLSTQLADLRIDTKESGAMHDATQRGWIKRLFDFAKPL